MKKADAVALIHHGIDAREPQHWADLGCGSGTFTDALTELLHAGSLIDAVDRKDQLILPPVNFIKANFETQVLPLHNLDGILMANSLHFVKDKQALIHKLETYFSASPAFLIVEYDTERTNPWVPYPISFQKLTTLFTGLGYTSILKLAERPSVYNSAGMYSALIKK
jgi:trans-aconitate methyltransferase